MSSDSFVAYMTRAVDTNHSNSKYYPSMFGEIHAERVARESQELHTIERIHPSSAPPKQMSLFDDNNIKRLEFCGTINFCNYDSENAALLRQFAQKLPALHLAMDLSIESLTYWELDVKHHNSTHESACLPVSSAWIRFKCVDFIMLLCNSAISLFYEASNSLPNMSPREMSVMGPDLVVAAKMLFPSIESDEITDLLDEMYKHIYAYLSCASLLWIELYDVEYRMFVQRKTRSCHMNDLNLDILSNICSKALKRSTKTIAQQASTVDDFNQNARWRLLLEHTNQYRLVNRVWSTIPLFETRLCAVEWVQPHSSLLSDLNDHSTAHSNTHLRCFVLLLFKLESMLKTNQENIMNETTHPRTNELITLNDTLIKQCDTIRSVLTNNKPLHQYVVEHNKSASVYASNELDWKVPAAAIYGLSAFHNCSTVFDESNGIQQRLCNDSHFVEADTNFKWCTARKMLCLRAQMVHSFFGVVFAHSRHTEYYHLRCQTKFASSHETLNRTEDNETYDITDWLYKEGLLRGTKQSDPQKLKLSHGGICAYFQLDTNSRNIHQALGKHMLKQNSKSYVRFKLVRGVYDSNQFSCGTQTPGASESALLGDWMEVRTECKSRFLNKNICGKRSRSFNDTVITDSTNTLNKRVVSVSVV